MHLSFECIVFSKSKRAIIPNGWDYGSSKMQEEDTREKFSDKRFIHRRDSSLLRSL